MPWQARLLLAVAALSLFAYVRVANHINLIAARRSRCRRRHRRVAPPATGRQVTSNAMGTTIGFLLGPALATSAAAFPRLLYCELVLSAAPLLCCLAHYPAAPSHPPSAAAAAADTKIQSGAQLGFLEGVRRTSSNRHFVVLVLSAGLLAGVSTAWQSLLQVRDREAGCQGGSAAWQSLLRHPAAPGALPLSHSVADRLTAPSAAAALRTLALSRVHGYPHSHSQCTLTSTSTLSRSPERLGALRHDGLRRRLPRLLQRPRRQRGLRARGYARMLFLC